ncbi:MAG: outer membrane protein assembly factor BamD [Nitrospirae bacterium]|nr:outer membrane protein assembly factor BamD [Nitrospirota bacterium]
MLKKYIITSSVIICLASAVVFTGCAGTTKTDTLSSETESLKELYDAKVLLDKGDKLFKDEDYSGAAQEYRRFLEYHPVHKSASYVQYRIALSYFNRFRTIDRDIEPLEKALAAFEVLVRDYPLSEYKDEAVKKTKICKEKLAEREFYIGNFYLKQEAYPAAIERFNIILKDYSDTKVTEKASYYLSIAYSSNGKSDRAVDILKTLLEKNPETEYKKEASELLARLSQT